ncbi:MAG: hypothetical protein JWQ39_2499 [Glaciihabitans sp.]|nr:hypothetical protein [Glaciihabitans sp.]
MNLAGDIINTMEAESGCWDRNQPRLAGWASQYHYASGMDVVETIVVSLATGAVAAALVNAFFAVRADKRRNRADKERWLRERRYEVYREFLVESDFLNLSLERNETGRFTRQAMAKAFNAVSAVGLIGPQNVYLAASAYQDIAKKALELDENEEAKEVDWERLVDARTKVGVLMQEKIGVSPKERMAPKAQ